MQVNDLIFKELLKRGYTLEGNTKIWDIADSKLWYLEPEQAKAYLDLEKHKDYSKYMFEIEIELLKRYMPDISKRVLNGSSVNIIDIGCGDGKKAVVPLETLHKNTKVRYCPIDISSYMVTQAIDKIKKLNMGEVVEFRWNISDFDNLENVSALLRDPEYRQNLFLFLGGTIGNFEMHEVMYEITEAMNKGQDYLIIGCALSNRPTEEILKAYKHHLNDEFFGLILLQLGFSKDEISMDVRYRNSRIELFYTVLKEKYLHFGGKKIHFRKGDQILIGTSYRYKEEDLRNALKMYFSERKFYFDKDKTWVLALCKK